MKPEIKVSSVKPSLMQYIAKKASILSAQGPLHYLSVGFIRKDIEVVIVSYSQIET